MVKKKVKITLIAAASIVLVLAALFGVRHYTIKQTTAQITMNNQEKENVKKQALQYLGQKHSSNEIEKTLLDAFEKLDPIDCTDIVDVYLYGVYNACAQYTLTDDETNVLYRYVVSDGKFDFSDLKDESLKKMIEERNEEHIVLRYLNGSLYWDTDYGYFDETFGSYVIPDYRDMIHFYAEERTRSYYDEATSKMYPDVVIDRLEKLYQLLRTYPDSEIRYFMEDSYYLYKSIYLGAYAQDYIYDNGKLRPEVMESYKSYSETCSDPDLASFIKEIMADYEEVDNTRTIPIYEKIKDFCGFYVPDNQVTKDATAQ